MTDLATLGIRIDSSQVKTGVADLDKLTAAGARAEAATVGLGKGSKTAAAEAAAMAAAAQASARAATGMATGFKASSEAMRVNTVAMRETLVVARELSRGNFSRIPGSLTLLAQGIGSQGGLKAFASALTQTLGLVKTVENAELAEQAASAAASAAAIESAAARASAAVTAADAELALAEAQLRVTAGTSAEGAAQVRLAEAHQAVAAAAGEAAIAENALASAYIKADEAAAAAEATATRSATALGASLGILATAAGLALTGFQGFKMEVAESGELDRFAEGLRLTSSQIEAAGGEVKYLAHNVQEVTGLTITFGDVIHGTFNAVAQAAGTSASQFRSFWREAFLETAQVGISAAQVIAGAFAAVGSIAKNIQGLAVAVVAPGNPLAGAAGTADPKKIGQDALNAFEKQFAATGKFFHETLPNDIIAAAKTRLQKLSDRNNPPKPPKAKPPKRNPADDEIAKLDAQIKSENALADAYLTSDAAAIKAQADEKALVLAVEKHANAAQTAALKSRELALAIATISKNGAKAVSDINFETAARKKVNDMVAAGIIPASQANNALKLEEQLRPLVAAASLAEGDAKKRLLNTIKALTDGQAALNAQVSREAALRNIAANDNDIERLKLENSLMGASNKERAVAIAQLDAIQKLKDLPGLSPQEQNDFVQSYINKALAGFRDPLQQWAASIPQTADAITESLKGIEANGLDSLASAITDVVTGAKSLKEAFKDTARSIIADIVQMTVKMLIFRALTSIFGSAFGGGSGIPSASPPIGSANGNIFAGGSIVPFANGGVVTGPTLFPMRNGTGLMGEAGPEAVMPLARDGHGRLGVRANDNQSGPIELRISFGDAPDFVPYVESVSLAHSQAAVKVSTSYTNETVRRMGRPKMMGGNG